MILTNRGEPRFTTSSIGQIAFLLWHNILPDDLTLPPNIACMYFTDGIDWGELINSYWMGEKIPICEMAECMVTAQKLLKFGKIEEEWFREMQDAIIEVRSDYAFPI